jgi:hypothetical protein
MPLPSGLITPAHPPKQQGVAWRSFCVHLPDDRRGSEPVIDKPLLDFLRASFRSVWTLELALFLWREPRRDWRAHELVRDMRSSEFVVREGLATLIRAGLVGEVEAGLYRFLPTKPSFEEYMAELEVLYKERPVSLIEAIFSAPDERLRTFADAFKLRRD